MGGRSFGRRLPEKAEANPGVRNARHGKGFWWHHRKRENATHTRWLGVRSLGTRAVARTAWGPQAPAATHPPRLVPVATASTQRSLGRFAPRWAFQSADRARASCCLWRPQGSACPFPVRSSAVLRKPLRTASGRRGHSSASSARSGAKERQAGRQDASGRRCKVFGVSKLTPSGSGIIIRGSLVQVQPPVLLAAEGALSRPFGPRPMGIWYRG